MANTRKWTVEEHEFDDANYVTISDGLHLIIRDVYTTANVKLYTQIVYEHNMHVNLVETLIKANSHINFGQYSLNQVNKAMSSILARIDTEERVQN